MSKNTNDSTKLCMCFDFSLLEMKKILSDNPKISFERLLEISNAGSKCTACLLDLEHYFVNLPRNKNDTSLALQKNSNSDNISVRRKIFRWLDHLSPSKAIALRDDVPVLGGKDLNQWLWLANYELLYAGNDNAEIPDFDVDLKLFDSEGTQIHRQNVELGLRKEWHGELSQYLPKEKLVAGSPNEAALVIGRLEITRRARTSGVRGTTRPQIELVTPNSNCAVHGQAAGYSDGGSINLICRPDDDRIFLSILNPSASPIQLDIQYSSISKNVGNSSQDRTMQITIPAWGARLHEVQLNDAEIKEFLGNLFRISWVGSGIYKCHAIISSLNLDRFSIDHL